MRFHRHHAVLLLLVPAWFLSAGLPPQPTPALSQPVPAVPPANKSAQGNRLAYLDELDPYYVGRTFPKLTTPMWVGDKGVEAVVILAIDDMRETKKYESFLRPILNRLKKIDGRAPVSIMTCSIDPKEEHLQKWLKEGLSLEVHTYDHPCPFFKGGSFAKAKETYDKCVDLMASIPNNKPVAFRMPCCDSLNTPSPRHWAEIFNKTTAKGNFLTLDSSVFHLFTSDDPELPRELVLEKDGTEKFRKYLPKDRTFVNTIENYPYPYVIGKLCWQFPCMMPSDWAAQHLHKSNNPQTVADWKCALDATVIKQGVFNLVFHPHGWIKNDQIIELIDYAVEKHGGKVKFLTFKEAEERLNKNLLAGQPLRHVTYGFDAGVRLLDLNHDGYIDVIIGNGQTHETRIWSPKENKWIASEFPSDVIIPGNGVRFAILQTNGYPSVLDCLPSQIDLPGLPIYAPAGGWHFDGKKWTKDPNLLSGLKAEGSGDYIVNWSGHDYGIRLRDLDGDGICELIVSNPKQREIFSWQSEKKRWQKLTFTLPDKASILSSKGEWNGVRFIDLNEDGHLDVVFSNENDYGVYLFKDMKTGWSEKVLAGKAGDKGALPMIANKGTNNGMWVHSRSLWWGNEATPLLKDHVDRVSFKELLQNVKAKAKTALP